MSECKHKWDSGRCVKCGITAIRAELDRQQAEIARLTAELADCRNAIARLDAENERLHEEVADEHMRCAEAREAARWCCRWIATIKHHDMALARWPWLEHEA